MSPRCWEPGCLHTCPPAASGCAYACPDHGDLSAPELEEWNSVEQQVWLRSRQVSYSTVLARGYLLADGTVRAPGLEAFTWEQWPEPPPPIPHPRSCY